MRNTQFVNFRELLSTQIIRGRESRIKAVPSGLCFCVASCGHYFSLLAVSFSIETVTTPAIALKHMILLHIAYRTLRDWQTLHI